MEKRNSHIEGAVRRQNRRRLLKRAIALLSAFVLVFTVNTLKRPASTLERIPMCGFEYEHFHGPECFDADGMLICQLHEHTDACYQQQPVKEAQADAVEGDVDEVEFDLGGEAPEQVEEPVEVELPAQTVPEVYSFDLGDQAARLSDIIAGGYLPVALADIEFVGMVDDETRDWVSITPEENDYIVRAEQDFDAAELAIATAEDIQTVMLLNGVKAGEAVGETEAATEEITEETVEETVEQIEEAAGEIVEETTEQVEEETAEETTEQVEEVAEEVAGETEEAVVETVEAAEQAEEVTEAAAEEVTGQAAEETAEATAEETVEQTGEAAEETPVEVTEETAEEAGEETVGQVTEEATEEATGEIIEEAAEEAEEKTEEEASEETAEQTGEAAEEPAAEATENSEEVTEETAEQAEEEYGEATEEAAEQTADEPTEESEDVTEEATEETAEQTEEETEEVTEETEAQTEEEAPEEAAEQTADEPTEESEDVTEEATEETVEETEQTEETEEITEEAEEPTEVTEEPTEVTEEATEETVEETTEETEQTQDSEQAEEAEEPTEAPEQAETSAETSAAEYAATIDLTGAEYPLSLRALLAQAERVLDVEVEAVAQVEAPAELPDEAEVPETENTENNENTETVEAAEPVEATEPADTAEPAEPAQEIAAANWALEYDDVLIAVEAGEDDYAVAPLADFESTQIIVNNGSRYALTLVNCTLPEAAEAAPEIAYPAQSFEGRTDSVKVSVTAAEGAFPEGAAMVVEDVEDEQTLSDIEQTVGEDFVEVKRVHAVDISFYNAEGEEIEPLIPISVVMTVDEIEQQQDAVVVHVDSEGAAEVVEQSEAPEADGAELNLNVEMPAAPAEDIAAPVEEIIDTEDEMTEEAEPEEAEVRFEADSFSVYAVVVTETIETRYIAADGATWNISVGYDAEAGIPSGATLAVEEVPTEDYLDQAAEALAVGRRITDARFFDITILDENGQEVQPAKPVTVNVTLADEAEGDVNALHFAEDGVELLTAGRNDNDAITFDAPGFSVYGIVYTVDFHWEVDGKTYNFSIPGGGFLSLKHLVEALNLYRQYEEPDTDSAVEVAENTGLTVEAEAEQAYNIQVDEEVRAFVASVENVEFSAPELLSVSKVEENTTVGAIKEALGLECEYSDELTDEEIEVINAEPVEAGDWSLISLKPFDTEETITITMKSGEICTIIVTDDAAINPFGLGEQTYCIFGINKDNHNSYCLTNWNSGDTAVQGSTYSNNAAAWTFEYTHVGKLFLIHDNQGNYIYVDESGVHLTKDRAVAEANPILVHSKEGKYAFTDSTEKHGINIYSSEVFGRWWFGNGSDANFWLTLQSPEDMSKPGTIATADTRGVLTINLFNYGPEEQLDIASNSNAHPANAGVNVGKTLKFFSYGETIGSDINEFTGTGGGPNTGIVDDQLNLDYPYPVLAGSTESLDYLFGGTSHNDVQKYGNLNHLFTLDEHGYYHYDSNDNYAYLSGPDFKVYSKTFPEEGADEKYYGVGFFPFNDYNEYFNCIHGLDESTNGQTSGFNNWGPHNDGTDKNGHYDHHFGMTLTGNFIMPPDGQYDGNDVIFKFAGDDDMWVFVDGILIMDIGGIHNPVKGEINFKTGDVTVHGNAQENFKEKYKRITGKDWDDSDYSNHDFRVFYMERGGMYSNLELTFNLPLTPKQTVNDFSFDKVSSKEDSLKLEGARFALFTDNTCETPFTLATIPVECVSDDEGLVAFKNIPYGTYYMKETEFPAGYQAKSPEEIFKVDVDKNGGTVTKVSGEPVTAITNEPKTFEVEAEKLWQNGTVPAGASVEIVLGRYKLVEAPDAPGKGTLVIRDSYSGLPSGSEYRVTYTITGPDNYSKKITRSYTDANRTIEETVNKVPAGVQYTVTKQVEDITNYNVSNSSATNTVIVQKNGSVEAQFAQSTISEKTYRVCVFAVNRQNWSSLHKYSENYYPAGSCLNLNIENYKTGTWDSEHYKFICYYNSSNGQYHEFTSTGWWTFTESLNGDVNLYVYCQSNSGWEYNWTQIKTPTITGAAPVTINRLTTMRRTVRASAALAQTATPSSLPDAPENTLYVLDEAYAAKPDTITLTGNPWTGKASGLEGWNEYGPYVYYIAAVNETGVPEGTVVTISDEVTLDGSPQVLTVTNNIPSGYLQITKSVTYNGHAPSDDAEKQALAGNYTFGIFTDAQCTTAYQNQKLTITIGNDGVAKNSEVVRLPAGAYWIKEDNPGTAGITPEENPIAITVTASSTSAVPGIVSFVNNRDHSDNPDELAINLKKTFTGLLENQIPNDFQVILSYDVPGSASPVIVPLTSTTAGHVICTKSADGLTWYWHVTHIPSNATNFGLSEVHYDVAGYTRSTEINGNYIENPGNIQPVEVIVPTITMSNATSNYTTTDNNKVFTVADNQILLVRMTNHATVIVSQKSLGKSERTAIELMINGNGGKVPGDGAQAEWVNNYVYFSKEIHGDKFSYNGRTIYFEGNTVKIPHKSSSHEVRVDVGFVSETADNSFTLENIYSEVPITIEVEKVKKGDTNQKLPGAVFTLRQIADSEPQNEIYISEAGTAPQDSAPTAEETGRTSFTGLTSGYYELKEKIAPAGYILTGEATTYFKIDGGVLNWLEKGSGKPSTWSTKTDKGDGELISYTPAVEGNEQNNEEPQNAVFVVQNEPGARLPSTGGSGVAGVYAIGSLLVLAAALLLAVKRRKTMS